MGKFTGMLFASDLDGTLLDSQKRVSEQNRKALTYFIENGGLFTIATGRSKSALRTILDIVPINAPALMFNGAVVYDTFKDEPVYTTQLDPSIRGVCRDICARFPQAGAEAFLLNDTYMMAYSEASAMHFKIIGEPAVVTPEPQVPDGWIKLIITGDAAMLREIQRYVRGKYSEYNVIMSLDWLLEIFSKSVDKGVAVKRIADLCGIEHSQIYAAGDHYNDEALLKAAACAFVPENGMPDIKAIADKIVPDCDSNAIAAAIDWLDTIC